MNQAFLEFLSNKLSHHKVLLLGFGREGQSSWRLLKDITLPGQLGICDKKHYPEFDTIQSQAKVFSGRDYLQALSGFDFILRSPGIPATALKDVLPGTIISSQSALFLDFFSQQVIGVTGTKGKSTTSTLIQAMLIASGRSAFLAGNIGLPPFEVADRMEPGVTAVLELSAHQLEDVYRGPHIACLLNLFEEHLDHFKDPRSYHAAKWKLFTTQNSDDTGIFPSENPAAKILLDTDKPKSRMLGFGQDAGGINRMWLEGETLCFHFGDQVERIEIKRRPGLPGRHNQLNALAAAGAVLLAGGNVMGIESAIAKYKGLPHRLEYLGKIHGRMCYNDAIATAPEATIAAIETLGNVDTLLVGGMDRGIAYTGLIDFLIHSKVRTVCASGPAGARICDYLAQEGFMGNVFIKKTFHEAVYQAVTCTPAGGTILLSPSAPSYDEFGNFIEKGEFFARLLREHETSGH